MRLLDNPGRNPCRDRLIGRRKVVVRTLDYLDAQRTLVDANREWKNPLARYNRRRLLDQVHDWYDVELQRIDMTLTRLNHSSSHFEK